MAILVGKQTVGVQIDLALFDIVPVGACRFDDTSDIVTDLTVDNIIGAFGDLVDAVRFEVDFTVFHSPGAILVGIKASCFEVDLTFFDSPPAEAVLIETGCLEVDNTLLNSPPAVFVLEDAGFLDLLVAVLVGNKDPFFVDLLDPEDIFRVQCGRRLRLRFYRFRIDGGLSGRLLFLSCRFFIFLGSGLFVLLRGGLVFFLSRGLIRCCRSFRSSGCGSLCGRCSVFCADQRDSEQRHDHGQCHEDGDQFFRKLFVHVFHLLKHKLP